VPIDLADNNNGVADGLLATDPPGLIQYPVTFVVGLDTAVNVTGGPLQIKVPISGLTVTVGATVFELKLICCVLIHVEAGLDAKTV